MNHHDIVTKDLFDDWSFHPVTKRLMRMLQADREMMKEGLVNGLFTDEADVRGRCKALAIIMSINYEDLMTSQDANRSFND